VALSDPASAGAARQALARWCEAPLVLSDAALEALAAAAARQDRPLARRAEALALLPRGATLLLPAAGGEPGVLAERGRAAVALLPAERAAALAIARERLLPRLAGAGARGASVVRTLRCVGLAPEEAAARVAATLEGPVAGDARAVAIDGEAWVRLTLQAATPAAAEARFAALAPALRAALGPAWYGVDDERLEAVVGELLRERGLTL